MATLAVLGVGTGVGKSFTSAAILRAVRDQRKVAPFKPVESGIAENGGVPADAALLLEASGLDIALERVCPWPLPRPVAPASEFERLGRTLELQEITLAAERLRVDAPNLLFEGAGGVLSPITWELDATHIARALGAQTLLVAPDTLGAMSAIRTAAESLERRGITLFGVALNRFDGDDSVPRGENRAALERWVDAPIFEPSTGTIPEPMLTALLALFEP